mmetsp:Transcript_183/g.268  ORF Transcript_183/g.268 Transcript_183/m.268 type:complete len:85 (+) Transcript_183:123-377(+)|eukprot:CAMPEP_0117015366 /NCGR_PEP_ID=MMETSP0472-20121206/12291_1 /TAXON_ID=693140 ORGANISM="Tiarina fusus, Strain LIS" /NCGR_SAMPLE_ID=MMETSP0472 /ASSEMBLY_ACC=CAM_ASM_000603 /LENGTH=84 /DNA_ID=CAMNT_0004719153 /DNA_START=116 /DNA_END=370 /DNA_ORIENTATION=+
MIDAYTYDDWKASDWSPEKGKTLQDVANYAASKEGSIGFAYDPEFFTVEGEQNLTIVFSYKNKSPKSESWPLALFDEAEANIEV